MVGFQYLAIASNAAMDILSASPDLCIQVSLYMYVTHGHTRNWVFMHPWSSEVEGISGNE